MVALLIILTVVLTAVVAWRRRVPLVARLLGQSEARIDRRFNQSS